MLSGCAESLSYALASTGVGCMSESRLFTVDDVTRPNRPLF